jgi:hypothetical protein
MATDPRANPEAPPTPLRHGRVPAAQDQADRFSDLADLRGAQAREANRRGDDYVMTTVMFAAVLFFGRMSTELDADRTRQLSRPTRCRPTVGCTTPARAHRRGAGDEPVG